MGRTLRLRQAQASQPYKRRSNKTFNPLMCALGASGQGKTDTLNFICRNAGIHKLIIDKINNHDKTWNCKDVAPLFATFNQSSTFNSEKEPTIESAQCNRLLSNYIGVQFDSRQSARFDIITLQYLLEFIRRREAAGRGCASSEICVIVLVDDVLKVIGGAARVPRDNVHA